MSSAADRRNDRNLDGSNGPGQTAPARVLVLGAGVVGSTIVDQAPEGVAVTMLSRRTHPELARPDRVAAATIRDEIDRHGASAVINCVGLLRGEPDEMAAANTTWPTWLAGEVMPGTGARLVHLGSAAEYGDPGSASPITESHPVDPRGSYGETKWAGSAAVLEAGRSSLDAVVARGFNFVGPQLPPSSPLHQFVADVSALGPAGGPVEVWWPDTVRDFILVTDLAKAVLALAGAPTVPDVVNVCSGTGISFAEAVEHIAAIQGKSVQIRSLDRPGIRTVIGDNRRLVSICGFAPAMSPQILAANAAIDDASRPGPEPAGAASVKGTTG